MSEVKHDDDTDFEISDGQICFMYFYVLFVLLLYCIHSVQALLRIKIMDLSKKMALARLVIFGTLPLLDRARATTMIATAVAEMVAAMAMAVTVAAIVAVEAGARREGAQVVARKRETERERHFYAKLQQQKNMKIDKPFATIGPM